MLLNRLRSTGATDNRDKIYGVLRFLPDMIKKAINEKLRYIGYTVDQLYHIVALVTSAIAKTSLCSVDQASYIER